MFKELVNMATLGLFEDSIHKGAGSTNTGQCKSINDTIAETISDLVVDKFKEIQQDRDALKEQLIELLVSVNSNNPNKIATQVAEAKVFLRYYYKEQPEKYQQILNRITVGGNTNA